MDAPATHGPEKRVRVADLRPGDLIDLEGDPFGGSYPAAEFELAWVASVTRETADCVAVGVEGFDLVGFPSAHELTARRWTGAPLEAW